MREKKTVYSENSIEYIMKIRVGVERKLVLSEEIKCGEEMWVGV